MKWRIKLFSESGSMVEETFNSDEDAVGWVEFRPPSLYGYMEVESFGEDGAWHLTESRRRLGYIHQPSA